MTDLPPIVAHERTPSGWRGLTAKGELVEVTSDGGPVPPEVLVYHGGREVGRRVITQSGFDLGTYLTRTKRAVDLYQENRSEEALAMIDEAIAVRDTPQARLNRSIILLALGRWREGFAEHEARFEMMTPPRVAAAAARLPRWRGEDLEGKRLMLVHDAGYGDSVMCARYVPVLQAAGAEVVLSVPEPLRKLLCQLAVAVKEDAWADYYCPLYSLPHALGQGMDGVPSGAYLYADPELVREWRLWPGMGDGRNIGLAWRVGAYVDGDYPRECPLKLLADRLRGRGRLYSLQVNGQDEADSCGVAVPKIRDFADVAALASLMDEVVTVDTAALHVAGAIGHRRTSCLLSYWASWRFLGNRFYPDVKLCRQARPGDWGSALAQL